MLELGKSKPWPDAMEKLTSGRDINTGAILRYFKPLQDWLTLENANTKLGWKNAKITWT